MSWWQTSSDKPEIIQPSIQPKQTDFTDFITIDRILIIIKTFDRKSIISKIFINNILSTLLIHICTTNSANTKNTAISVTLQEITSLVEQRVYAVFT